MIKTKTSNFEPINLVSYVILILYFFLGFVPNWEAVDRIAPQWLVMNLLNLVSLAVFFYYRKSIKKTISKVLTPYFSLFYIAFIFWAGLSYFYAINSTEVVVNISRQFNVLLMFLSMAILLFNLKNKARFISWTLSIILSVEIYAVLVDAIDMINTNGIINPNSMKGVTANRNITAFSIAIKIPFVLYLIGTLKKISFKVLFTSLVFFAMLSLSMIQSRASFIALGSYALTEPPALTIDFIKFIEGASRISSVSGLNDKPQTAIDFPAKSLPN